MTDSAPPSAGGIERNGGEPQNRIPDVLYKYCSESGVPIIRDRLLKVTRPIDFNDPFEFTPIASGKITPEDVQLRIVDPEWPPRRMLLERSGVVPNFEALDRRVFRRFCEEFAEVLNRDFSDGLGEHLPEVSRHIGVLCLSAEPKSVLMWSHYASNHRGFVVGIDRQRLGELPWLKVRYDSRRAMVPASRFVWANGGTSNALDIITSKSEEWAYEKEYRVLFQLEDPELADTNVNGPCKALPLREAIIEVWLGVRSSARLENDINDALKASGSQIIPRRLKLGRERYELNA